MARSKNKKEGVTPYDEGRPTKYTMEKINEVSKLLSKGKSRTYVVKYLMDNYQLAEETARKYFAAALDHLKPSEKQLDKMRESYVRINLDRLEKIIESTIDSSDPQKLSVARQTINDLNKMLGISNEKNNVTIAKNTQGDEIINIQFQ